MTLLSLPILREQFNSNCSIHFYGAMIRWDYEKKIDTTFKTLSTKIISQKYQLLQHFKYFISLTHTSLSTMSEIFCSLVDRTANSGI